MFAENSRCRNLNKNPEQHHDRLHRFAVQLHTTYLCCEARGRKANIAARSRPPVCLFSLNNGCQHGEKQRLDRFRRHTRRLSGMPFEA